MGILIEKEKNKKAWLTISILSNILLLGIFKYYNFFITNINELTGSNFILLHLVLPIGLSFHTFQSLSYTIEVYYGRQKAVRHAGYFALYVMFYPQLVAGPIERPQHLLPQFFIHQKFCWQKLYEGLRLMAWGLFKKVVVADRIGLYADAVFKHPAHQQPMQIWLAVFFFSIQIYADFSGYSDIAIGAARCMGIDLCVNFNRPYQSVNIRAFWQRWHISLSSWFRDYVYIPLGGGRKGKARKNLNLMITFILSALWHGAGWTFIVWGFLHGIYMLVYTFFNERFSTKKIPSIIAWFVTCCCVAFAWIFFRASSVADGITMIYHSSKLGDLSFGDILAVSGSSLEFGNFTLAFSFCAIAYMLIIEKFTSPKLLNFDSKAMVDTGIFVSTILLIIFFGIFQKSSFIYFQF
jgi:D-alanyl-lipoteichoic acid acyltransferase DltB (MBOAT superfamily)